MAGVNQPKPNPPAENINNATTPDIAAALCEASVAHFHRPASPFHQPRLDPIAHNNTATIAATAGNTSGPVIHTYSRGVIPAVSSTKPIPPPINAATRPGCHTDSSRSVRDWLRCAPAPSLPGVRSRAPSIPASVKTSVARPVRYLPPVNRAAPARTAISICPIPSSSVQLVSPERCCHHSA
ncbi:Uncharacterised protein [Mycobacteroides abscessus subsp. abscessus]|nr:Uncharacterised protein [Mycobacteroides abscessus subsp. abscessus]